MKGLLLFVILALARNGVALGIPMMPETIPVRRLVAMANAELAKNPENAEAQYTLARVHYLAFVCATTKLQAYVRLEKKLPLPRVEPFQNFTTARREERDLADEDAAEHITKALEAFEAANNLAPKNSSYRLGYASLLEQASDWAKRHPKAEAPEKIRALKPADIREAYRVAWQMELKADLKEKNKRGMFSPMDMVSYEAGTAFVRLYEKDPKNLSADERKTLTAIQKSLKDLTDSLPIAVTPVVFATRPVDGIADLLAPSNVVKFPLRGWGPAGQWPWVQPDTVLLVWNPSESGVIRSGAQLFGSYTWELFWKSGYEPLAVLDGDGNGQLRGEELSGIAAWIDRNGNGFSDPGEVHSLEELGVVALAASADHHEGPHPMNRRGVTFSDGRVLPTWDWVVEPAASEVARTTWKSRSLR